VARNPFIILSAAVLCGLLFTHCARAEFQLPKEVEETKEVIQAARRVRICPVFAPRDLDPRKKVPLIVAFHGYRGDVKTWFYEETAFVSLLDKEKFIIAFPEAPVSWDAYFDSDDVKFFDALVEGLAKKYPVDPERIYVVGHSNGAAFASFLFLTRPKVVAAGAVASGLFPTRVFPAKVTQAPLMVIWGEKDHLASASSNMVQMMIFGYKEKEIPVKTLFFPEGGHPWPDPSKHVEEAVLEFLFANRLGAPAPVKP